MRFSKESKRYPTEKMGTCEGFQKRAGDTQQRRWARVKVFKTEQEIPNREDGHVCVTFQGSMLLEEGKPVSTDLHARSSLGIELAHFISDFLGEEAGTPFLLVAKHAGFSPFIGQGGIVCSASSIIQVPLLAHRVWHQAYIRA